MSLDREELQEILERPLADTTLQLRTINVLEDKGLLFVQGLLQCCGHPTDTCVDCGQFVDGRKQCGRTLKLMEIPNFGEKTLKEVFTMLEELGLEREPDHPSLTRKKDRKKHGRRRQIRRRCQ